VPRTVEDARGATVDDLAQIVFLARLGVAELAPMRGGELWSVREAREEPLDAAFAALLDRDDVAVVVGTIDEVVVGFGVGRVERLRDGRRHGVVDELFVEPDARSVGVGEAVVSRLLAFFGARGCSGADALALPGNRATKNFFEQQGFVARAIVMHKPLSDAETETAPI
jgi:ribosomal protein S18 acetylase RimI-like enzyme